MSKKVLLVEDDRVDQIWVSDALAALDGVDLAVVSDGRQALDYLRVNGPATHEAPALVLLDLGMPDLNGFEVLREFMKQVDAHRVPVVVFSASTFEADVYLSYKFGANAYVIKPSAPGRLQEVVRTTVAFWLNSNVLPPAR